MSDTGVRRDRPVVLLAGFSWATGLLTGVLLSSVYGFVRQPKVLQTEQGMPWPSPSPDCPARKIWSTCDPIPRSSEDVDKALMKADQVGWVDVTASGPWTVKVDGTPYGWVSTSTRQPIVPGSHNLDLFDYRAMRHARCPLEVAPGHRFQVLVGTTGNCIVTEIPLDTPTDSRP
jgi:hypothetical protein